MIGSLDISKDVKASGCDGITNSFLKQHNDTMATIISLIFNRCCVGRALFPKAFKTARVVPIPKNGPNSKTINEFRPISLLSSIGKILEKLIYQRIMQIYTANNYLYNHQFGSLENSGTNMACLELVNQLQIACDQGRTPAAVFFDLSAAFDTIYMI